MLVTTHDPELIDAEGEALSAAAAKIYEERGYEGKVIPVTQGSFAGLSEDFSVDIPINIKIDSCDEFDPTGDGYCDLFFYGKPATEEDWNHEDIKPLWDEPKPSDAQDMTDDEWVAFLREQVSLRVIGIIISAEDGEVREFYGEAVA